MKIRLQPLMRLFLIVLAAFFVGTANAAYTVNPDFKVDDIYYTINEDGETVSVDFKGTLAIMGDTHNCYAGDIVIPETVENNGKTYTVTGIMKYAFYFCRYVTSVKLPSTLEFIQLQAFQGCTNLTQLSLPSSLKKLGTGAFAESGIRKMVFPDTIEELPNSLFQSSSIESVQLPFNLKTMQREIFRNCKQLTSIIIPNDVEEIPYGAFGDSGLQEISLPTGLKAIGDDAFNGTPMASILLPSTVESIGANAFSGTKLVNITMPASLKTLGEKAFYNCEELDNVVMGQTQVTVIGKLTFRECKALKSIDLPNTLETIDEQAFMDDEALVAVDIPSNVITIGSKAFHNCIDLSITLLGSDISIEEGAFCKIREVHISDHDSWVRIATSKRVFAYDAYSVYWAHVYESNGDLVTDYDIPEGINSIGYAHFRGNTDIKTLKCPQSLKNIQGFAFYGCTNLESVDLGGIEEIGKSAFNGNTSLKTVKFGKTIKKVGGKAFDNCKNIETVDIGDLGNWCEVEFQWSNMYLDVYGEVKGDETFIYSNPLQITRKVVVNGKQLDELNIPKGVTKINNYTFTNCLYFDKVTIPNTVTSIGYFAFAGCIHLEKVVLEEGSSLESLGCKSFYKCAIANIQLPNTVKSIDRGAFEECTQLKSFIIPQGIIEIPQNMFCGCTSLEGIEIHNGIKSIGENAFYGCNNDKFTTLTFPPSIEHVGVGAFSNCDKIKGVYITDLVAWCGICFDRSIYDDNNPLIYANYLYLNDDPIIDLVIPDGVTEINQGVFLGYKALTSITIPEGVTSVGDVAFSGCSGVNKISLPASLTSVGERAFSGTLENSSNELHIKDLAAWARNSFSSSFATYPKPKNIYINNILINNLVIPEVAYVGCAFKGWNIETVTIPKSVEGINTYAFYYCKNLRYIYSQAKFAPSLSDKNTKIKIDDYSNGTLTAIYVPKGRSNNYKSAWTAHTDIIREADPEMTGEQSLESISEMKKACANVYGANTYIDLTGATLDETVTSETLKDGDGDGNVFYYLPTGTDITGDNIIIDGNAENVKLTGGKPIGVPREFTAEKVIYALPITTSDRKTTTLTLPFDCMQIDGIKAYTMEKESGGGDLVFVEADHIKANKPYLIVNDKDISNIELANVTIGKTSEDYMEDAGIDGFEFYGTFMGLSHEDAVNIGAYFLQDDLRWTPVHSSDKMIGIEANQAYIIPKSGKDKNEIACILHAVGDPQPMGDVNGDFSTDVTDVVAIVNSILGQPSAEFDSVAADLNGDGEVDIFDAMEAVIMVLNANNSANARGMTRGEDGQFGLLWINASYNRVMLSIDDASRFTAFQFDVEVADGVELVSGLLAGCADTHNLHIFQKGRNSYRVVGVSMGNKLLNATSDGLLELTLVGGNSNLKISNIKFVTPDEQTMRFTSCFGSATDIDTISREWDSSIYNLSGQKVKQDGNSQLSKGVYIIGNKKVIIK